MLSLKHISMTPFANYKHLRNTVIIIQKKPTAECTDMSVILWVPDCSYVNQRSICSSSQLLTYHYLYYESSRSLRFKKKTQSVSSSIGLGKIKKLTSATNQNRNAAEVNAGIFQLRHCLKCSGGHMPWFKWQQRVFYDYLKWKTWWLFFVHSLPSPYSCLRSAFSRNFICVKVPENGTPQGSF
jgi:hypothetical protein